MTNLSAEHQAKIIENRVDAIVKDFVLPYVKEHLDELVQKHLFDALSFIYRDEIQQHIQKVIKADLINQFQIEVKMKGE